MKREFNHEFFMSLMNSANMGWWEADIKKEYYVCYGYLSNLLGLDETGIISFADFNKRILKEEQQRTSVYSFAAQKVTESVYLLKTVNGDTWVRSKLCFQETDDDGNIKAYGIAEVQDAPGMASAYQVLQHKERIWHHIFQRLPVGVELYNKDGILIELNDKELEMFHLSSKEDILGVNIFDNPIFPKEMKKKLKKHQEADFTFRYDFANIGDYYKTRKKQGTIDLVTKVTTLYDNDNEPVYYLLINADKTETTVAYNKIQEFESFFELVGDYAKVGYAHFNILTGEGYAQNSWYYNVGEKEGTPLSEIIGIYNHFRPEDRMVVLDFFDKVKKGTSDKLSLEVCIRRENGEYSWTHIYLIVRKYDPQHNIIEIAFVNYDITQLKQTEEMLIKAKNKAEESDRLKSAFVANMSHEIRTPLNAIIGFSDLLLHTEREEEKEEYNQLINNNTELLLKLINDIIDISKLEAGYVDLCPTQFSVSGLLKESAAECKSKLSPDVRLIIKESGNDYMVELDRMCIKQILNNLLSNALKNTSQGYIEIACEVNEKGIKLSVADTGCGIPERELPRIFERFEKVDSFVQGVGLGLSVCKSIAERIGGSIGVTSEVGVGSTFWVELPCQPVLIENIPQKQEELMEEKDLSALLKDKKILIAEDNESNYLYLSIILKGAALTRAKDGEEAVAKALAEHFDMILMDICMPHVDGIEAASAIRMVDAEIPIIAVTANAFDADREKAIEAGCNDYVSKPIMKNDLFFVMQKYL